MKKPKRYSVTSKYILLFGVLLLLMNIILGVVLMTQSGNAIWNFIRQSMLDVSNTAADMLDGDVLASLTEEDVGTPKYQELVDELNIFQNNNDILYIYTVRKINDDQFIFTVDPDPVRPAAFGEAVVISPSLREAGKGIAAADSTPYQDSWGYYYSAYSPIYDSEGNLAAIVGVDFDSSWYDEQVRNNLISIAITTGITVLIGILIVLFFTRSIQKRLQTLDDELDALSLDVDELKEELLSNVGHRYLTANPSENDATDAEKTRGDEIETLGGKVRSMHEDLKKYLDYAHSLAYTDGLTGVGNTSAYLEEQDRIKKEMETGEASFLVIVFDIDDLKKLNDQYGHAIGDRVIRGAAAAIEKAFGIEKTFRIGGDEFLSILEPASEDALQERFRSLDEAIRVFNENKKADEATLSLSKGYAAYRPDEDKSFRDIFIRADEMMYREKEAFHK